MSLSTRLLIARHGNTFAPGETVRRVGITDLPLVESGLMQGRLLGHYLQQNKLIPDVIYTSTLQRAIQTAEQAQAAIPTHLPIEHLVIFNEIDYGQDENQPEEQVLARLGREALQAWETEAKVPEGWNVAPSTIIQNWQAFALNIKQHHVGKTILVITSNGIARFAPHLTGNFSAFAAHHGIKIATGALCIFETTPADDHWYCSQWNMRPTAGECRVD
jgi:2,3-bisphosphoglycerate-dependent phosphoglycerate mutase